MVGQQRQRTVGGQAKLDDEEHSQDGVDDGEESKLHGGRLLGVCGGR
jgi:hypothetical protein